MVQPCSHACRTEEQPRAKKTRAPIHLAPGTRNQSRIPDIIERADTVVIQGRVVGRRPVLPNQRYMPPPSAMIAIWSASWASRVGTRKIGVFIGGRSRGFVRVHA